MMTINIDNDLSLETLNEVHAEAMFSLIDSNRQHLKKWLPWVDHMQSIEIFLNHIEDCKKKEAAGTDYAFVIVMQKEIAGRAGIHYVDHQNKFASLGYWLGAGFQGKGIITKSCKALIDHCFNVLGMNRVEIKCATGNLKSRAIAEKLNFKKEAVIRQGEFNTNKFYDIYLYSMLKEEWDPVQ